MTNIQHPYNYDPMYRARAKADDKLWKELNALDREILELEVRLQDMRIKRDMLESQSKAHREYMRTLDDDMNARILFVTINESGGEMSLEEAAEEVQKIKRL